MTGRLVRTKTFQQRVDSQGLLDLIEGCRVRDLDRGDLHSSWFVLTRNTSSAIRALTVTNKEPFVYSDGSEALVAGSTLVGSKVVPASYQYQLVINNETEMTITKGMLCVPTGSADSSTGAIRVTIPTIGSDNVTTEQVVGIAVEDISPGTTGIIQSYGLVEVGVQTGIAVSASNALGISDTATGLATNFFNNGQDNGNTDPTFHQACIFGVAVGNASNGKVQAWLNL